MIKKYSFLAAFMATFALNSAQNFYEVMLSNNENEKKIEFSIQGPLDISSVISSDATMAPLINQLGQGVLLSVNNTDSNGNLKNDSPTLIQSVVFISEAGFDKAKVFDQKVADASQASVYDSIFFRDVFSVLMDIYNLGTHYTLDAINKTLQKDDLTEVQYVENVANLQKTVGIFKKEVDAFFAALGTQQVGDMQQALWSIYFASTNSSVDYNLLTSLILKLAAGLALSNKQQNAKVNYIFSAGYCNAFENQFKNSAVLKDLNDKLTTGTTNWTNTVKTLQNDSQALITCIQNKDAVSCSTCQSASDWLAADNTGANTFNCLNAFTAYVNDINAVNDDIFQTHNLSKQLFNFMATLPATAINITGANVAQKLYYQLATNSAYITTCLPASATAGSYLQPGFNLDATQVKGFNNYYYFANQVPTSGTGPFYVGNVSLFAGQSFDINVIAQGSDPILQDSFGNIFFDQKTGNPLYMGNDGVVVCNPATENCSTYNQITNFWLLSDGTIKSVCPVGQLCVPYVGCPADVSNCTFKTTQQYLGNKYIYAYLDRNGRQVLTTNYNISCPAGATSCSGGPSNPLNVYVDANNNYKTCTAAMIANGTCTQQNICPADYPDCQTSSYQSGGTTYYTIFTKSGYQVKQYTDSQGTHLTLDCPAGATCTPLTNFCVKQVKLYSYSQNGATIFTYGSCPAGQQCTDTGDTVEIIDINCTPKDTPITALPSMEFDNFKFIKPYQFKQLDPQIVSNSSCLITQELTNVMTSVLKGCSNSLQASQVAQLVSSANQQAQQAAQNAQNTSQQAQGLGQQIFGYVSTLAFLAPTAKEFFGWLHEVRLSDGLFGFVDVDSYRRLESSGQIEEFKDFKTQLGDQGKISSPKDLKMVINKFNQFNDFKAVDSSMSLEDFQTISKDMNSTSFKNFFEKSGFTKGSDFTRAIKTTGNPRITQGEFKLEINTRAKNLAEQLNITDEGNIGNLEGSIDKLTQLDFTPESVKVDPSTGQTYVQKDGNWFELNEEGKVNPEEIINESEISDITEIKPEIVDFKVPITDVIHPV